MGKDGLIPKGRLVKMIKKIISTNFPNLEWSTIEPVVTNSFNGSEWEPYGYTFFISVKHNSDYSIRNIEDSICNIIGHEIVISLV
jgi:hypothetical protein